MRDGNWGSKRMMREENDGDSIREERYVSELKRMKSQRRGKGYDDKYRYRHIHR